MRNRTVTQSRAIIAFYLLRVALASANAAATENRPSKIQRNPEVPPSWEILPIPRYVDYGSPKSFITIKNVAIVRKNGGPYQSVRDKSDELVGQSSITEEELAQFLKESGVPSVTSVADNLPDYGGYDTLILLGSPQRNAKTANLFAAMKLSFAKWDDLRTSERDFNDWKDFGKEGYLLKVGKADGKNIVILAGYDYDDAKSKFYGAGTFYAIQSVRQLFVKDEDTVKIKIAEVADKPLVAFRGYMVGFAGKEDGQPRDVAQRAGMKANNDIYWYGNAGYNPESASRWRYPWTSKQLADFAKVGKNCREHFITMNFCLNPDHYGVEWAAAKTFDGKTKDPLHYDSNHSVEPEFKEMWAKLGYEVNNDVDILAAKYGQIHKIIPGEFARLQMWNEDDVFGLVHPEDKKLYNTVTPDQKLNAINYGKARGLLIARLYKRIRELYPDSPDSLPLCPPAGLHYHYCFENNDQYCREFMTSLGDTQGARRAGTPALPAEATAGGAHHQGWRTLRTGMRAARYYCTTTTSRSAGLGRTAPIPMGRSPTCKSTRSCRPVSRQAAIQLFGDDQERVAGRPSYPDCAMPSMFGTCSRSTRRSMPCRTQETTPSLTCW